MKYKMFAEYVPGPRYAKKGWGCQDSADKWEVDDTQIIAVADGHGSGDCFRSEYGSHGVVQTAYYRTIEYCKSTPDSDNTKVRFSETGIANLKYDIWTEWKKLVKKHFEESGELTNDEIRYASVSEKYKARYTSEDKEVVQRYLYTAYGTTLLVAVAIETQLLLMQIGDGTCVILQRNGEFRTPVPHDEDNFLNVTTSLCEENAYKKIRHVVIDREPNSPTAPIAVFLSTDGVDDCYPVYQNEKHLYKLYAIILENILKEGFEATTKELKENLLPGMTAKGSQDDISLAGFVCENEDILWETFNNISECYKPKPELVTEPIFNEIQVAEKDV